MQLDFLLKGWKSLLGTVKFESNSKRIHSTNTHSEKVLPISDYTFWGRSVNFEEIAGIWGWKSLIWGGGEPRFSWSTLCKASAWTTKDWLCSLISLLPHVLFSSSSEFHRQKFHWIDLVLALTRESKFHFCLSCWWVCSKSLEWQVKGNVMISLSPTRVKRFPSFCCGWWRLSSKTLKVFFSYGPVFWLYNGILYLELKLMTYRKSLWQK